DAEREDRNDDSSRARALREHSNSVADVLQETLHRLYLQGDCEAYEPNAVPFGSRANASSYRARRRLRCSLAGPWRPTSGETRPYSGSRNPKNGHLSRDRM